MATDLFFQIAAGTVLLCGVLVAWRWGWRDAGKGTRRCPRCWYDMRATAGLKCSECGREAQSERKLFRKHRKWRWMFVGFLIVAASYPVFKWPLYLKDGVIGFVPRTLVFALLPEISDQIRLRAPRGTPRGISLALKLSASHELGPIDRFLLAHSFDRMLRAPELTAQNARFIMRSVGLLGDCAEIAMPRLAELLAIDSFAFEVWPELRSLPYDEGCHALVPICVKGVVETPQRIAFSPMLELLPAWGASDEQMRAVLLSAVVTGGTSVGGQAQSYLWSERLAREEDVADLVRRAFSPDYTSMYATWSLASLPQTDASLALAREQLTSATPAGFVNACTVLAAAGSAARDALPALDAMCTDENASRRAAAQFTAACVRGESTLGTEPIKQLEEGAGKYGSSEGHLMLGLAFYSPLSPSEKLAFLDWRLSRDLSKIGKNTAPVTLELSVIMLGHMGKLASDAVPRLLQLCRPGGMHPVKIAAMDAVCRIGISSDAQMTQAKDVLEEWKAQPSTDPATQLRLRRLGEAIKHSRVSMTVNKE